MTACGLPFSDPTAAHTHAYLWPVVERLLPSPAGGRLLDLGCGNGAFAQRLQSLGFQVTGVYPSPSGVGQARSASEAAEFIEASAEPGLAGRIGTFPVIVSLEVIEHVFSPQSFSRCVQELLEPGGRLILSTPYHGYWKNLALALSGKLDGHFTALWEGGHIKFWSVETLTRLFTQAGLARRSVHRVGRIPVLAKSMVLVFEKPHSGPA